MPDAPQPDQKRLRTLWALALLGGAGSGFLAGAFALSYADLNAGWLLSAVIALGVGVYAGSVLLTALVWLFARPLLAYFGDTNVDREGDAVKVTPSFRLSGDTALDWYIASFSSAYAVTLRSLVWVLIILTVTAIAWIASLFGLVEFSLW